MPEKKSNSIRRETLVEKIIRRTLETVGGSIDRLFGRGRRPDALPDTNDLGERLRKLIDNRAQVNQDGRKLAPHLIRLKYAWGQSSDEFLAALKRLENELLVVAVDHINDYRYATLAPVKISSKADILTTGFTLSLGFDETDLSNTEAVEVPVEIYAKLLPQSSEPQSSPESREIAIKVRASFPGGKERKAELRAPFGGKANFIVGRMKECDLYLEDPSVSKHHASLVFNPDGKLRVADVGSTNGTFLNGERITYGKAYEVLPEVIVGFGDVKVSFAWELPQLEPQINMEENASSADQTFLSASGNAEQTIKIGVSSTRKNEFQEPDDDESPTELNSERGERDRYQTFVDEEPSDKYQTFVDEKLNDEYKTFVNEKSAEEVETHLVRENSAQNSKDSAKASETGFGSDIVVARRLAPQIEANDFTQSASNELIGGKSLSGNLPETFSSDQKKNDA